MISLDANEAVADVAYRTNEVVAIYPITPASPMGEHADAWAARGKVNLWGGTPDVIEMQSEGGAAGAVHGALQAGTLATTFTASQGLLLMLPNMYKIAGELTPMVLHVAARSVATHALSIFGDHSDVYAARQTGFAMLASGSVQEAHDFSLIAQAASLRSRIPFLHFFDGFRTSHEIAKFERLSNDDLRALIDDALIHEHRSRSLSPDHPSVRGTAQNPDAFFQAREAVNTYYAAAPEIVQATMQRFADRVGRRYGLVDYVGHPQAERVIVMMGSGAETAHEAVEWMVDRGDKVGLIKVRLYRPFPTDAFLAALPETVKSVAVLDRTKEPGAPGEPLYLDVVAAVHAARQAGAARDPIVVGGRYGLSSKEFTPAMVMSVFDELAAAKPKNPFTVGIVDDVTHLSLSVDTEADIEPDDVYRAMFYGLGSDGTVGANKNSIKILGETTDKFVQGYFVYDSKKAGAVTVSHLRVSPRPIRSTYLIRRANFVACHQWQFLDKLDMLEHAANGATFLINAPYPPEEVWDRLPREVQQDIVDRDITLYAIDAYKVAVDAGMGRRINTVMQTCFFSIADVLDTDQAIGEIKQAIEKTYGKRGEAVVKRNFDAVDAALAHLNKIEVPKEATSFRKRPPVVAPEAPDFVQRVTATMLAGKGDLLPVSAFPPDGTWPLATAQWEKRNIAQSIPVWDDKLCIQCNKCALVCPHAAVRAKVYPTEALEGAPDGFQSVPWKGKELKGQAYTIQVAPEDCTGCTLCVEVCPARDKSNPRHKALDMASHAERVDVERERYGFFLELPEADRTQIQHNVKMTQLLQPLFEYSGACAGCGETPYVKLLTQLFGDRAIIANATGCSSIYGGNLPTTPYTTDACGRGPAWSNSLFEDNAEFGLGMRISVDYQTKHARHLVQQLSGDLGDLAAGLLEADQSTEAGILAQRERVAALRQKLDSLRGEPARELAALADYLVDKSVWLVGGDGWAYDIGYGGLDHVLASGRNVNILVLDTEVYSNTGGQASKATPIGASAKFAADGKELAKKDLGLLAMSYGNVYVANIALGAKDAHAVNAFVEAEAFDGPSLIIAYSHCIAHGYDMARGLDQQKLAVETGYWPLYRYDPRRRDSGEPLLHLDSKAPKKKLAEFAYNETRYRLLLAGDADRARSLMTAAQAHVDRRFALYQQLARPATTETK